jgi:hypothetical protein
MTNNFVLKSPAYFGKLASKYEIGHTEIGYDELQWCVSIKNNRYVWIRKTEDLCLNKIELNKKINIHDINNTSKRKKHTIYNEFLDLKMKELKDKNLNLKPKELFSVAVKEWHNIKTNKDLLDDFLYKNKKND